MYAHLTLLDLDAITSHLQSTPVIVTIKSNEYVLFFHIENMQSDQSTHQMSNSMIA